MCSGVNVLMGGNPNGSNGNSWSRTDTGARIDSIQGELLAVTMWYSLWGVPLCCISMLYIHVGERVFVLDYNGTDEDLPSFSQTMDIPDNSIVFSINMR